MKCFALIQLICRKFINLIYTHYHNKTFFSRPSNKRSYRTQVKENYTNNI